MPLNPNDPDFLKKCPVVGMVSSNENWSYLILDNGDTLKFKTVAIKIRQIPDEVDEEGQRKYLMQTHLVMAVENSANERKTDG